MVAPVLDDALLLARSAAGDRAAFGQLVVRHRNAVYRWARSLTRSDAVAEEVMQETFLAAYRHAETYKGAATVRSWLFTIARNQAHRRGKQEAAREGESLEQLGERAGWGAEDPESCAERAELRRRLRTALASLSAEHRAVIVARDLEGLTGPEAAASLGLSSSAMKARLHRARLELVAALREPTELASGEGGADGEGS